MNKGMKLIGKLHGCAQRFKPHPTIHEYVFILQ